MSKKLNDFFGPWTDAVFQQLHGRGYAEDTLLDLKNAFREWLGEFASEAVEQEQIEDRVLYIEIINKYIAKLQSVDIDVVLRSELVAKLHKTATDITNDIIERPAVDEKERRPVEGKLLKFPKK